MESGGNSSRLPTGATGAVAAPLFPQRRLVGPVGSNQFRMEVSKVDVDCKCER